jgi:(1->4)-alpha-D-glucan 1-alpha-D-glucosylmutase
MLLQGLEEGGAAAPQAVEREQSVANRLYDSVREELLLRARETPLSTYRVQLHQGFNFRAAAAVVPYLAKLGVSELYASPYLKASPGSTHGYDCVDHQQLNPEVGSTDDHAALCRTLREHGLGQVLDVVPNHMGIERFNPLWFDVLENGPVSMYAKYFDIAWAPVKTELRDKVLLPILGDQYGIVLENGELKLAYRDGAFFIQYYDHHLPLAPKQYSAVLGHELKGLEAQLGADNAHLIEVQSILTSIEHLPERTDTERTKVIERNREKEVIKRRLAAVVEASPEVAAFVTANVEAFNGTPGNPRSFDRLDGLLASCSYRLAHWRVAGEEINYRRFFDINGLAAIRVEDPEVFDEAHARVFDWLREGCINGLRIDHPDGLFDPMAYFLRLQERFLVARARARFQQEHGTDDALWAKVEQHLLERYRAELAAEPGSPLSKALFVVVEKIQGGKERIPEAWAVHGTTGYRFANAVGGLFVQQQAERHLTETYHRFIGEAVDFEELVYQKKLLVLRTAMASELNMLANELNRISEMNRRTRDFTLNSLRRALVEFIALFPVYRTYVDDWRPELDARDVQYIEFTLSRAKARNATTNASIFDFLRDILLRRYPEHLNGTERSEMLRFAMKLQQVTGPVMAKGLEDTAFYIYNRLVSLNEVGGEPEHFGIPAELFHQRNQERAQHWPASLLTTSTHDTKRSEDVRARLNVLTEVPDEWRQQVRRWARLNARYVTLLPSGPAPSHNDEYLFYQTLVGAWPMGDTLSGEAMEEFQRRVREYMAKAIKEAKVRTSWTNPDADYDGAMARFVDACFDPKKSAAFLESARRFKRRLERPGQLNALGQLVLKLASPGVVDTYQGCELWDLSLVDPDNRRPVDYALRERLLEQLDREAAEGQLDLCSRLMANMDNGRVKLYVLAQGLRLRKRQAALFRAGGYRVLDLEGPRAQAAVALAREHGQAVVLAVVPRFTVCAFDDAGSLAAAYEGTFVNLPEAYAGMMFRDVFSGRAVRPERGPAGGVMVPLSPLFASFPAVLLERSSG